MRPLLAVILLPLLLTGCVTAAVGGVTETGVALAEERSLGDKIDDSVIYSDVSNQLIQKGTNKLYLKVTVRVRHQRVMLTGIVPTEEMAQQAVSLAWQAKGVKEVINELIVGPDNSYADAANDSLIKKNLEGRILVTKEVWLINYSIDVVNGTAYLLGRTKDRPELNRVLNVARTTKGIKRVVNHLQVISEMAAEGTIAPVAPTHSYSNNYAPASPVSAAAAPAAIPASQPPTDGTISTDSVSSKPLAPAGGGF